MLDNIKTIAQHIFDNPAPVLLIDTCSLLNVARQAPSDWGKSESKDCVIVEHYLKLAALLRQSRFTKAIIFITSNKKDYGSALILKPPLNIEFETQNILYCNNFRWAVNQAS